MPDTIQQNDNQLADLSDDRITAEILIYKDQVGYGMIELGKRLIEMKRRLGHGKFTEYLTDTVDCSEQWARVFMKIATEFPKGNLSFDLGIKKLYLVASVPTEDRETFVNTPHQVETKNGTVEKTVEQMTVREVEQVIKLQKQLAEKDNQISNLMLDNQNFNKRISDAIQSKEFAQVQLEKKEAELRKAKSEIKTEYIEIETESPELQKALFDAQEKANELNEKLVQAESKLKEFVYIDGKEKDRYNLEKEINRLKVEHTQIANETDNIQQLLRFEDKIKIFIKEEMLHIPTLIVPFNMTSDFKNRLRNIHTVIDNFNFAFKEHFNL